MRDVLADAFMHGLKAVDPRVLIRFSAVDFTPDAFVALGKAAPGMARGALERWPGIQGIVVTTRDMAGQSPRGVEVYAAGHPLPDEDGLRASSAVEEFLSSRTDTIALLLSGGGSAILPSPIYPLGLEELREITEKLMLGGAGILELNLVRRHIEKLKGGGMLAATSARIVTMAISDVVTGQLWAVASGPTVSGGTTAADAKRVLEKYGLEVDSRLERVLETGKPDLRSDIHVVADNRTALQASAARLGELLDSSVYVVPGPLVGEARLEGKRFAAVTAEHGIAIAGGETVVNVTGRGKGGRNQEMALSALMEKSGMFLFASTDGVDGGTSAAGAFVDHDVKNNALKLGLEPRVFLEDNDSHSFFSRAKGLFETGPTGTNVCDIALGIKELH